jgi:hypothetical protein
LHKILEHDEYDVVAPEDILPGDIIIYWGQKGDIEHSGIVVDKGDPMLKIPLIISKWGKFKELIHRANNCPYNYINSKYYRIKK